MNGSTHLLLCAKKAWLKLGLWGDVNCYVTHFHSHYCLVSLTRLLEFCPQPAVQQINESCALVEPLILHKPEGEVTRCKWFKDFKANRDCASREISLIMKSEVLKETHTHGDTTCTHTEERGKKEERKEKSKKQKGKSSPCDLHVGYCGFCVRLKG